jgi:hypothetical protein
VVTERWRPAGAAHGAGTGAWRERLGGALAAARFEPREQGEQRPGGGRPAGVAGGAVRGARLAGLVGPAAGEQRASSAAARESQRLGGAAQERGAPGRRRTGTQGVAAPSEVRVRATRAGAWATSSWPRRGTRGRTEAQGARLEEGPGGAHAGR